VFDAYYNGDLFFWSDYEEKFVVIRRIFVRLKYWRGDKQIRFFAFCIVFLIHLYPRKEMIKRENRKPGRA